MRIFLTWHFGIGNLARMLVFPSRYTHQLINTYPTYVRYSVSNVPRFHPTYILPRYLGTYASYIQSLHSQPVSCRFAHHKCCGNGFTSCACWIYSARPGAYWPTIEKRPVAMEVHSRLRHKWQRLHLCIRLGYAMAFADLHWLIHLPPLNRPVRRFCPVSPICR